MSARTTTWFGCLSAIVACSQAGPAAISGDGIGAGAGLAEAAQAAPELKVAYTEYLGQMVGRTPNSFSQALGMAGTDLGISYQRGSKLYFLFGDTWVLDDKDSALNLDAIATTSATLPPGGVPRLDWVTDMTKHWLPLLPRERDPQGVWGPAEPMGIFNVPVEGIPVDDATTYLFFHAAWDDATKIAKKSILARVTNDDFNNIEIRHTETTSTKFLSVSAFVEGDIVWIFGAGAYRNSQVHLARVHVADLEKRELWQYYDGKTSDPEQWPQDENNATALTDKPCVGELSVRKHNKLGYLMTYNCERESSEVERLDVWMQAASAPQGPWSEPQLLFKQEEGAGRFYHDGVATLPGGHYRDDGLRHPQVVGLASNPYGPYLVPAWFDEPGPGLHGIVYTLSSSYPYTVHLMRTVLAEPGFTAPPPTPRGRSERAQLKNPSFENGSVTGWVTAGEKFDAFQDAANGGKWTVKSSSVPESTTGEPSAAQVGTLSQTFEIDAQTSRLRFWYSGAEEVVLLHADSGEVLRSSSGDSFSTSGTYSLVEADWNLDTLRGMKVTLVIRDDNPSSTAWITASDFRLE